MALRGTLTHRKTRRLAQRLGIDPCFALGLVEALWNVTAEQAPAGDIGRMSDDDIAMEMFYSGDPEKLIAALVVAGFVDLHPEHRLVVHDWHLHSDDATDNKVARHGMWYANGAQPRLRKLSEKERARLCALYGYSMRTPCAQESTDEHEKALPEPVPVPVPDLNTPQPPRGGPSRRRRNLQEPGIYDPSRQPSPEPQEDPKPIAYWSIVHQKRPKEFARDAPAWAKEMILRKGKDDGTADDGFAETSISERANAPEEFEEQGLPTGMAQVPM